MKFNLCIVFTLSLACLVADAALADQVTLTTGEVLQGSITSQTDVTVVLNHPVLGKLAIPADKVAKVMTDAQLEAAQKAADEAIAEAKAAPADPPADATEATADAPAALEPDGFFDGWESTLDAGLSGTSGNSQNFASYINFKSKKETDRDRWLYDASYRYASEENESSTNRFSTGIVKDWLLPDSDWFYFADGRYDWDQFQSWQSRVTGHGGVGYQFIKDDTWDISGRTGIGAIREFGSDNDTIRPEALAGVDASWKLTKNQSLTGSAYIYPDFDDLGEFRAINKAEWTINMPDLKGAAVKAGIRHEHQSVVDPGDEHNDFWYYAGVSFKF